MDINQQTPPPPPVPPVQTVTYAPVSTAPGMLGTKMPSVAAFAVAVLLFFMPFVDIKCNGQSLQTISGVQLATGFKMSNGSSNNPFMNDIKPDRVDEGITKTTTKSDDKDPNLFAMIALGLGVLGLILSFTNAKAALGGAVATGIASAAALIGLMLDVKKKVKMDMPNAGGDNDLSKGMDNIGKSMKDNLNITVDFTPWFYIAVIAFLAAAFFCYKRIAAGKVIVTNRQIIQ